MWRALHAWCALSHAGVWVYGPLAVWVHGHMGVWPCVHMGIWPSGRVGTWAYGCLAVWAYGHMGIWPCGHRWDVRVRSWLLDELAYLPFAPCFNILQFSPFWRIRCIRFLFPYPSLIFIALLSFSSPPIGPIRNYFLVICSIRTLSFIFTTYSLQPLSIILRWSMHRAALFVSRPPILRI